jgi:hypothetical protein
MSAPNVLAFLRLLGERPELLGELKTQPKERVLVAAQQAGMPFTEADFDPLIWGLEDRLAAARGEGFDAHFPLFRTLWGRYYLEMLVEDLVPSLQETGVAR